MILSCYKCGEETEGDIIEIDRNEVTRGIKRIRQYCPSCSDKIRHADQHGREIDQFEARFVE